MYAELTTRMIRTIQDAAKRLTGAKRRRFEAQVAIDYCQGSPRKAETIFGWGRTTVQTGLDELQTGITREDRHSDRGRRKSEDKLPQLEEDIRAPVGTTISNRSQVPVDVSLHASDRSSGLGGTSTQPRRLFTRGSAVGPNHASSDEPLWVSAATRPKGQTGQEGSPNRCHLQERSAGKPSLRCA